MAKCPYRFPARSRAAMINAMERIGGYGGWNAPGRQSWAFAWNVKVYSRNYDELAETLNSFHPEGGAFDPTLDAAFASYLEESDSAFWGVVEQMRHRVTDCEWSDYDGNTGFEFEFAGRSGGHLVLTRAHGRLLQSIDFDDMREDKDEWPFADVRTLYRSLMVMDRDFSDSAVRSEWLFQLAHYRYQWESDKVAEREAVEAALIAEAFRAEFVI